MKKISMIVLACCLALMCAACAEDNSAGNPNTGIETTQPSGTEAETGTGAGTENETPKPDEPEPPIEDEKEITVMYLYINNNKLEVTLAENKAVAALVDILKQGDITYTAQVNSFEIYGDIGHNLPTDDTQITSQAGDVLLWVGSNICIFFGNNTWSYTRLGRINGYSASELRALLGAGNGSVQVRISLK